MTDIHPDITIYIQKLKAFFDKEPIHYKNLFGNADMYAVFKMITKFAIQNHKEFGDPVLMDTQFADIQRELNGLSSIWATFPPINLN